MGRRPRKLDPTASAAALFGAKLRRHREQQGWSQDQLGEKVFCTGDQISKIELAKRTPSWEVTVEFDRYFGTGEQFKELWHLVNKEVLPDWFRPYAELEAEARAIRTFELALVPGLLQTADYARAVLRTSQDPDQLDHLVAARMKRQEILADGREPLLWAVIDETVLHRRVGGAEVMQSQVARFIELAEWRNVTLQIVPSGQGAHPGLAGPLTILSFDHGPDVAYADAQGGGHLIGETGAVRGCGVRFDLIRASALSQEESLDLLKVILESL